METIGSKRSYALTWCMPNNDDDDDEYLQITNSKQIKGESGGLLSLINLQTAMMGLIH